MNVMPKSRSTTIIISTLITMLCMRHASGQTHMTSIELGDLLKLMEEKGAQALDESEYVKAIVTVDFASAHVFRGVASDNFVIQPGIEAWGLGLPDKYGFINIGTWGNIDINDNENTSGSFEFSEIDWYTTYYLPELVDNLYLFMGFIEYTFPTTEFPANKEINTGLEYWIANWAFGATAYFGVGGDTLGDDYYDVSGSYYILDSQKIVASIDALAGYYDSDTGPSGWNEGIVGFSFEYALGEIWSVGATLAYIIQLDDSIYRYIYQSETQDGYLFSMLSFSAVY